MTPPPPAPRSPRSSHRSPPHGRPTRRVCLMMADIEEADGNHGAVREWLGRAARAPHDKAWVAGTGLSATAGAVSPSGALDGFVWRTPDERIAAPAEEARAPTPVPAATSSGAIAAPPPAPALTPEPVEPRRRPRRPSFPRREPASSSIPHRWPLTIRAPGNTRPSGAASGSTPMNEIGPADRKEAMRVTAILPRPGERSRRRHVSKDVPERASGAARWSILRDARVAGSG